MATDKIRPCTAAELLAYQFMQRNDLKQVPVSETHEQQFFLDERDDDVSKKQRKEKEPVELHSPGNCSSSEILSAKELRASQLQAEALPPPASKREPSPSLASQMKRNKVTGKGVELLEKIAYIFDDDPKVGSDSSRFAWLLQSRRR